jgi:hypothetical protein
MRKIMRATLHDRASNTYYGQWTERLLGQTRRIDRSIARNEVAARVKFAAVDVRGAFFPGNRGLGPRENLLRPKK